MTFKKVWFGLGSRNGLGFLVADFFFFFQRAVHGLRKASEALVGLALLVEHHLHTVTLSTKEG